MIEYAFIYGLCSQSPIVEDAIIDDERIPSVYLDSLTDREVIGDPHDFSKTKWNWAWERVHSMQQLPNYAGKFSHDIEDIIRKGAARSDVHVCDYTLEQMENLGYTKGEIEYVKIERLGESLQGSKANSKSDISDPITFIFAAFELKDRERFEKEAEHLQERYGLSVAYFQKP